MTSDVAPSVLDRMNHGADVSRFLTSLVGLEPPSPLQHEMLVDGRVGSFASDRPELGTSACPPIA